MALSRKTKNWIIILAVLVVGVVALMIWRSGSRGATFKQDFHVEDIDAVSKIYMVDKNNHEVLLTRSITESGDTMWVVDGEYEASEPMVDMLLDVVHTMRIRSAVNKNAVPNVIKDLAGSSVKVEVYKTEPLINWFGGSLRLFTREHLATTYFVGRETQDQMASYMFREGDKVPYVIHIPHFRGYLTPTFSTSPYTWRSHRIVALDVKQIERVELSILAAPEESFAVYRDGETFSMELTSQHVALPYFDTARVAQMLISMRNLNFDEYAAVVPNSNMDTSFREGPRNVLRITDTAGNVSEVKTYIKYTNPDDAKLMDNPENFSEFDIDRLYAIVNNRDTVLLQYYVFDNILQPASFFIGKQ